MNTQINVRLPEPLLTEAKGYANKHGYGTVQELIKETLREKVFEEPAITKDEMDMVKRLMIVSEEKGLYGTEEDLFKKLRRK